MKRSGGLRVPGRFRRGRSRSEQASVESAVWLIRHLCMHLQLDDLGGVEVLDVGCGVKFSQALLDHSMPIGRYVGLDVHREMIDFLRHEVDDPRFEYLHVDFRNERYNPGGEVLTGATDLPLDGRTFDVICAFSVFTHLAPDDARAMLEVLRRYVEPDGRLFFTLYLDELTDAGHGLMDALARTRGDAVVGRPVVGRIETFRDLDPARPLMWAVYSERYARELIEAAGWEVMTLSPPDVHIQHHFVCAPR